MRTIHVIALITLLGSCTSSTDRSDLTIEDVAGTYAGVVPCADCEGIDYRVTLQEDSTFVDQMKYLGKDARALTASGRYAIEDGIIVLNKPSQGYSKFRKHPMGVLMLDKDGNEIDGSKADLYILGRVGNGEDVPEADSLAVPDSNIMVEQDNTEVDEVTRAKVNRQIRGWEEGVNFYGLGTEPFWNLAIDFSEGMKFTTLDSQNIQTPMGNPSQREDGKYRKYEAQTEVGELIVELREEECVDQMSGEMFDYEVTIMTKYSGDREYRTYKGCGEYVVDPRLHNIWVIEEFEGEKIDADAFSRGIPQIEINVRDDTYMGHDGCNSFQGGISATTSEIEFEAGPTTLMACGDNELSNQISLALTEKPYEFEFNRRLFLKSDGQVRFVLKNVD